MLTIRDNNDIFDFVLVSQNIITTKKILNYTFM
jgi:hypothetical protein